MRTWSTKCISCQMRLQLPSVLLLKLLVIFTKLQYHQITTNSIRQTSSSNCFLYNFCPINRFPFCQFNIFYYNIIICVFKAVKTGNLARSSSIYQGESTQPNLFINKLTKFESDPIYHKLVN